MLGEYGCGVSAAVAILAALFAQGMTNMGQHIDVSKQEAMIAFQRIYAAEYPNEGVSTSRLKNQGHSLNDTMPCKDGYVVFQLYLLHHWHAFVTLMGNPKWAQKEKYESRNDRAHHYEAEIKPHILKWIKGFDKDELYHKGQGLSSTIAQVCSAQDVMNSEHLRERDFFVDIEHPATGKITYPGAPYGFSETPWAVDIPAPLLGQHNDTIYYERLGYSKQELVAMRQAGII